MYGMNESSEKCIIACVGLGRYLYCGLVGWMRDLFRPFLIRIAGHSPRGVGGEKVYPVRWNLGGVSSVAVPVGRGLSSVISVACFLVCLSAAAASSAPKATLVDGRRAPRAAASGVTEGVLPAYNAARMPAAGRPFAAPRSRLSDTNRLRRVYSKDRATAPKTLEEVKQRIDVITNRLASLVGEISDADRGIRETRDKMAKHQHVVMKAYRGEGDADDEETKKLRERLAELQKELEEARLALRERLKRNPKVETAMGKSDELRLAAKTNTEKKRDLLLEKRKLDLELKQLERIRSEMPKESESTESGGDARSDKEGRQ